VARLPGYNLNTSRLNDNDPTPTATYPVHLITADVIMQQNRPAAQRRCRPRVLRIRRNTCIAWRRRT
jgi:hypothetical protein